MWSKLTTEDLKKILSDDEVMTLDTMSTTSQNAVQDTIDMVANMFRGAFAGKGIEYDMRDYYIPSSYAYYVLVFARYAVWTRFPNSPQIALDEARKAEYEFAKDLLKSCSIGTDPVESEHSSQNPDANPNYGNGKIVLPFLRFNRELIWWSNLSAI